MRTLAVDIHLPERIGPRPLVCCCVPGGGMSRGYFDLQAPASFEQLWGEIEQGCYAVSEVIHPGRR